MSYNLFTNYAVKQCGGGTGMNFFTLLLLSFLFLAIKVVLVQWSFNEVIPKFNPQIRRITPIEALFLIILVQSLFQ